MRIHRAVSILLGVLFLSGTSVAFASPVGTSPNLTIQNPPGVLIYGDSIDLTTLGVTTDNGTEPVQYSAAPSSTCAIQNSAVVSKGAGQCTITVSQQASNGYAAGSDLAQFNINKRQLFITATGTDKVYDGTTDATVIFSDTRVSGDVFTISGTAAFDTADVGSGKTVTITNVSITGANADNYTLPISVSPTTASITKKQVTGILVTHPKEYDQTATVDATCRVEIVNTIFEQCLFSTARFDTPAVGTNKPVTATGITFANTALNQNYDLAPSATSTADITGKQLSLVITATNKAYDGTTQAFVDTVAVSGVLANDTVQLNTGTLAFDTPHAGSDKAVTGTGFTITGKSAGNYTLPSPITTTATITPRPLSITASPVTKVYDGTTNATTTLSGNQLGGDDVVISGTASFDTKNIGSNKTVTVNSISLTGTNASDYTPTQPSVQTTGTITERPLSVIVHPLDKQYDGTTDAQATFETDKVLGDDVTITASTTFTSTDAAANISIIVGPWSVTGSDAGNYSMATPHSVFANISKRPVRATYTVTDKQYDGTTAAIVDTTTVINAVEGDDVSVTTGTATYDTKDIGTNKVVTGTGFGLAGSKAENYILIGLNDPLGTIEGRTITITGTTTPKVYDGTKNATVTLTAVPFGNESVAATGTAQFDTKDVGTNKTVTVTNIVLTGADAAHYTAPTTLTLHGEITPRPLTVTAQGGTKVYDQSTDATVMFSDDRITNDTITITGTATFADKNVGTNKTISVANIALSGTDAHNYTVNTTASTTGDITKRTLTLSANVADKVYDGTTHATVTYTDDRLQNDVLTVTPGDAVFSDKNVAPNIPVTLALSTVTGTDAQNYNIDQPLTGAAEITSAPIALSFTVSPKVYDKTTAATIATRTLTGVIGTEVVTVTPGTAVFDDASVGTKKRVTGSGFTLDGTDKTNYSLDTINDATGVVTAAPLTVSFTASNKQYDGTTTATIATRTISGTLSNDTVSVGGGTATFTDMTVGVGKTVTATGFTLSGADSGNYEIKTINTTTAEITAVPVVSSGGGGGGGGGFFGNTITYGSSSTPSTTLTTTTPSQTGTVLGASTFKFTRDMRLLSRLSPDVVELQKVLIAQGYLPADSATGFFGQGTFAAVKKYQSAHGLDATGFVGPATRAALNGTPSSQQNTTGTVLGASTFVFTKDMQLGSRLSPDVLELQKVLVKKGLLATDNATGYFGQATLAAVKKYQTQLGLNPTGYVGSKTRAELNAQH